MTINAVSNQVIRNLVRELMLSVGEDPNREGLLATPGRFTKAWSFWTSGYDQKPENVLTAFTEDGAGEYDELIFQGNIVCFSLCEHHLAPFFGVAHVGYLPNGKIIGLSKMARLVEIFSRRLTIQERICTQIADTMMDHLDCRGVGVVLQCRHLCMESRGVQKPGTITVTSALRGAIREHGELRAEFMTMVAAASTGLARP